MLINVCVYESGKPDWWATFDSAHEFFSWMSITFPGYSLDTNKSSDIKAFYAHGDAEIVVFGV